MKPICLICARGGSKGVPNKNIRILGKKPLIAHTIEKAISSKLFSHIIVSTEDKKIIQIAKKYGAETPFVRPKHLSGNSTPIGDVFSHAIKELFSLGYEFDVFVNLDCTVPFIRKNDISNTIKLLNHKKVDAVYGVYRQHLNPYFNMMEINSKGFLTMSKKLSQRPKTRQESPKVFQLNGLFTYDAKKFLKSGNPIMKNALPYEIPLETGFMIDTETEFKIAELMFGKLS
jgi:N-acylneuraminate cytidylyltransferase/CMP-N,N'-diacetyllegionaminic acid synthase